MKLSVKTTKALTATPRKLVMFRWPESRWVPRERGVYRLEGTSNEDDHFKIVKVACNDGVYDVAALMHDDPCRLLPPNVGPYQEEPIRVMRDGPIPEPEAVSEEVEAQFGLDAREKEASKMALVDAAHTAAERLRREVPEVGREAWQMLARANAARQKLNHKRGTLDFR